MNKAFQLYKPINGVTALAVSPHEKDRAYLRGLFQEANWVLHESPSCTDALSALKRRRVDLVISDRDLCDGDWRVLLRAVQDLPSSPPLIVTSRVADEYLWAEVLNEGGYDILAQPFEREEALRVISAATRRGENDKLQRSHHLRTFIAGA
ncbi:MAG: response regulator [Acidobacteria bacterium]|nr:response regulator [Acidobacteriota bacterium]